MRLARWWIVASTVVLGCRAEVASPELRRPIESMPAGACVLLVASDLANTWERAESHDVLTILRRALPEELMAPPELLALQSRLADFEARTQTSLRQDLWLNLVKQRIAVGVYPGDGDAQSEMLFVAELDDAERFGTAFEALMQEPADDWQCEKTALDGQPAWRVRDGERMDVLVLQDGPFLAVSTVDDLVRGALAIQHGGSQASALRESVCMEALDALGRHNVGIVSLGETGTWTAQGLTWDREGVHFKRIVPLPDAAETAADETPSVRADILRSIPSGMTLAYQAHAADMSLFRDLLDERSCFDLRSSRSNAVPDVRLAAAPLGLERLPFDLGPSFERWAGDEMAVVLAELVPTALAPLPSVALIVEVRDYEEAVGALQQLERNLGVLPLLGSAEFVDVVYGGKTYRSLPQPVLEALAPSYLLDGDLVFLASTRELLQQIIDTRRAGRRTLLRDATFRPFGDFVPDEASLVVYADQTKLHHALMQVAAMPRLWGEDVARIVDTLEELTVVFEHFPASVTYVERTPTRLLMSGWMREAAE